MRDGLNNLIDPTLRKQLKRLIKSVASRLGRMASQVSVYPPRGIDYGLDVKRFFKNQPVRTIFDVGANIGQTSCYLAPLFPQAKVFAFEPVAETFGKLKQNTAGLHHVESFHLALGSHAGTQDVYLQSNSEFNSLASEINRPDAKKGGRESIVIKTVDQFAEEHGVERIDLLKTDTEGYDMQVLRGAEQLLSARRVIFIVSESGFVREDRRHTFVDDLRSYLADLRYDFYGLYKPSHFQRGEGTEIEFANALFVHHDAQQLLLSEAVRSWGAGLGRAKPE